MTVGDMPSIANSAYGSATNTFGLGGVVPDHALFANTSPVRLARKFVHAATLDMIEPTPQQESPMPAPARRLVQVFIADPDDNVPLAQSMLYKGEQQLTDATDTELYFEIDIKTILEKHNAERVKLINKKVKERTETLEPAKIRDLKMVVVEIAKF